MHFIETIGWKSNNKTTKFIEMTLILWLLSKPSQREIIVKKRIDKVYINKHNMLHNKPRKHSLSKKNVP